LLQREGIIFQPFVWTSAPLFDENGGCSHLTQLDDFKLFRSCSDEYIFEQLAKDQKQKNSVPGSLTISVRKLAPEDVIPGRLSPSLSALVPPSSNQVCRIPSLSLSLSLSLVCFALLSYLLNKPTNVWRDNRRSKSSNDLVFSDFRWSNM